MTGPEANDPVAAHLSAPDSLSSLTGREVSVTRDRGVGVLQSAAKTINGRQPLSLLGS